MVWVHDIRWSHLVNHGTPRDAMMEICAFRDLRLLLQTHHLAVADVLGTVCGALRLLFPPCTDCGDSQWSLKADSSFEKVPHVAIPSLSSLSMKTGLVRG